MKPEAQRYSRGSPAVAPVLAMVEREKRLPLVSSVEYRTPKQVGDSLSYQAYEAGHIVGSSALVMEIDGARLIFSGDVGRVSLPISRDPEIMPEADFLIMESTYGDRLHKDEGA